MASTASGTGVNPYTNRPYSRRFYEILETRKRLPVWEQKDEFFEMMRKNQTMVLVGETGSGKTTQIPSFMVDTGVTRGKRMVACTQPRRVAAMSVSKCAAAAASPALLLSRSHALTLSRSHAHALTLSRSHALPLSRCPAVPLSRCPAVPLSRCPAVPLPFS